MSFSPTPYWELCKKIQIAGFLLVMKLCHAVHFRQKSAHRQQRKCVAKNTMMKKQTKNRTVASTPIDNEGEEGAIIKNRSDYNTNKEVTSLRPYSRSTLVSHQTTLIKDITHSLFSAIRLVLLINSMHLRPLIKCTLLMPVSTIIQISFHP